MHQKLANSDEYYTNNSFIRKGNMVTVNTGYVGWSSPTTITYNTYLITGISETFADGARSLELQLAHSGLERTARFTHPFYTEIIGNTGVHDTLEDTTNLYPAPKNGVAKTWFDMDFWDGAASERITTGGGDLFNDVLGYDPINKGGVGPIYIAGSHWASNVAGVTTADTKDHLSLVDHPEIIYGSNATTVSDVIVKIYAWSATSAGAAFNDHMAPILIVEGTDGTEHKVMPPSLNKTTDSPAGYRTSDYSNPPKTYIQGDWNDGSYPITYQFPGNRFTPGDKIKRVIIIAKSSYATTFCLERVRVENVNVVYDDGHTNTKWEINEDVPNTLELTKHGRTYMMFSQKPYSPTHFDVWARFKLDTPVTSDMYGTKWGVCGFASDAQNYIGGQYTIVDGTTGKFEIVMRRGGKEFVLGSNTTNVLTEMTLMLRHRNGKFTLMTLNYGGIVSIRG